MALVASKFFRVSMVQHVSVKLPFRAILVVVHNNAAALVFLAAIVRRVCNPGSPNQSHAQFFGVMVDRKTKEVTEKSLSKVVPACDEHHIICEAEKAELTESTKTRRNGSSTLRTRYIEHFPTELGVLLL